MKFSRILLLPCLIGAYTLMGLSEEVKLEINRFLKNPSDVTKAEHYLQLVETDLPRAKKKADLKNLQKRLRETVGTLKETEQATVTTLPAGIPQKATTTILTPAQQAQKGTMTPAQQGTKGTTIDFAAINGKNREIVLTGTPLPLAQEKEFEILINSQKNKNLPIAQAQDVLRASRILRHLEELYKEVGSAKEIIATEDTYKRSQTFVDPILPNKIDPDLKNAIIKRWQDLHMKHREAEAKKNTAFVKTIGTNHATLLQDSPLTLAQEKDNEIRHIKKG